jgi:DNA-binding MarR family transcriptional regulator
MPFYDPTKESWHAQRSIGYLARRASGLILSRLEDIFAGQGMTFVQWAVLMLLRDGLVRTAADICRDLDYDSGALTRVLDQLEQRGFIERRRGCQDRRVVELILTEKGRETAESLIPLVADSYNGALADFTREEAEALIRLLGKLIAGISSPRSIGTAAAPAFLESDL